MIRRRGLLLGTAGLSLVGGPGRAEAGPVTLVVPFPPGGGVDAVARAVADRLGPVLGQRVLVDNRPGGSTSIAAGAVARAEPDGRTLLVGTPALSVNPVLQPHLPPGDPRAALAAVGRISTVPYVLHLGPAPSGIGSLADLVAWARERPGGLTLANTGTATAVHLSAALLAARAGLEVVHVPYRGGAAAALDVAAGRVHGMFSQAIEALPLLREGRTRALAVSTAARSPALPDVPTVAETLPEFDVGSWNGLFAPGGTPVALLERLNLALREALAAPDLAARFAPQGVRFVPGPRQELDALLDAEIRGWAALAGSTGLRAES